MRKPDQSSNAGYRAAAANWGRFLWVTFLAKTRKVTGCRATPGGVDSEVAYRDTPNLERQLQFGKVGMPFKIPEQDVRIQQQIHG